jgi:hypothetical protein
MRCAGHAACRAKDRSAQISVRLFRISRSNGKKTMNEVEWTHYIQITNKMHYKVYDVFYSPCPH